MNSSLPGKLKLMIIAACIVTSFAATGFAQSRVTEVFLKADDGRMSGNCPIRVVFNGYIIADGPGTVTYTFISSDGGTGPVLNMEFQKAGSQPVTTDWSVGNANDQRSYSGWQAIRILSPNQIESSHETGAFSVTCAVIGDTGKQPVSPVISGDAKSGKDTGANVVTSPGGSSSPACYAVTLNGFTVNHATSDNALRTDGVGDEVFLNSPTFLRFNSRGGVITSAVGGFGPVFGERRRPDEPGRIQAGNATPQGGLQTGNSFPSNEPWRREAFSTGLVFPHALYEGALAPGELLVVIPSLWEWDNADNTLNNRNPTEDYLTMIRDFRSRISSQMSREGYDGFVRRVLSGGGVPVIKTFSDIGTPLDLQIELGPFSPGNRPIGMRLQRGHTDRPVFDPQVLFLTADAAEYMSRNNAFRLGAGVMPLRYRDDVDLEGDYTIYIQTEHSVCSGGRP